MATDVDRSVVVLAKPSRAKNRLSSRCGAGTAAVITPIGEFRSQDGTWTIGDGSSGQTTLALREELTGIQYGRVPDRHGWLTRLV